MPEFLNPITILILINIAVFAIPRVLDFSANGISSADRFLSFGWKDNYSIKNGEYYRLFTAMFLHGDFLHLFSNMWALFALGNGLANGYLLLFILAYFGSGILGNLFSFWFHKSPSVGASGAIFGLVGAILVLSIVTASWDGIANLLVYIALSFTIAVVPNSRIDIYGHLGGLIGGILITVLLLFLGF